MRIKNQAPEEFSISSGNHGTAEIAEDTAQILQGKKEYEFKLFVHYCQSVWKGKKITKKKQQHLENLTHEVSSYVFVDFKEENLDNIADILISGFGLDRPIEVDDAKLKELELFIDVLFYLKGKDEILFRKLMSKILDRKIFVCFDMSHQQSGIVLGIDKDSQKDLFVLVIGMSGMMRIEKMSNIATCLYTDFWESKIKETEK